MSSKLHRCDGCHKERRDVQSVGRDADGYPDAPDLCFLCRQEGERGREWSHSQGKYVPIPHPDYE